ncbi:MAG TPA: dienelactone hydrolase family protein [Parachlamydiaceae bacterium]|nr:dienelactone hydrolase family protein [Parachlamydiaceae bacterium]
MLTEEIHYTYEGVNFKGYLARPDTIQERLPAVIVAHAWRGQDDFARKKAEELAGLGYVGFAVDMYGNAAEVNNNEDALQLMLPLFLDRKLLRERIKAGMDALLSQPNVDPLAIGAIGFCFGGFTVIELLRSGANIQGAVSFHGLLGNTLDKYKSQPIPNSDEIKGSLLILHGFNDPYVTQQDIQNIQIEMTKANVDWQMNVYGQAFHAFTNPQADDAKGGLVYNRRAAERAWLAMTNFFNEIFSS